ncbi:MAG: hypothetical protein HKM02_12405 [Pseudomonadales bacterium]|nr:hypothetical protein [Pseudomonadales bacterium]
MLALLVGGCSGQGYVDPLAFANVIAPGIGASGLGGGVAGVGGWGPLQGEVIAGGPSYNPLSGAVVNAYGSLGDSMVSPTVMACASTTTNAQGGFTLDISACSSNGGWVWLSVPTVDSSGHYGSLSSVWTPVMNTNLINITPLTSLVSQGAYGSLPLQAMSALEVDYQNALNAQGSQPYPQTAMQQTWSVLQNLENSVRNDLAEQALSVMSYVVWGNTDFFITPITFNHQGIDALYDSLVLPSTLPVTASIALEGPALSGGNGSVLLSMQPFATGPGAAGAVVSLPTGTAVQTLQSGQASPQNVLTSLLSNFTYVLHYQDSSGALGTCNVVLINSAEQISSSAGCTLQGAAGLSLSGQVSNGQVSMTLGTLSLTGGMTTAGGSGVSTGSASSGIWTLQPL